MRKQLMQDFLASRSADKFQDWVDDIVEHYLDGQQKLADSSYPPRAPWTSAQAAYDGALREMSRRPIFERTLEDVERRVLPAFVTEADRELNRIVTDKRSLAPTANASPALPTAVVPASAASSARARVI
jgi:hypothetical protein